MGNHLPIEHDDPGVDAGELRGKLDVVDRAEAAALRGRLVVPGDAEQVERVEVPQPDVAELLS